MISSSLALTIWSGVLMKEPIIFAFWLCSSYGMQNLSQLVYINCDVVSKGLKDGAQPILRRRQTN